MEFCRIVLAAGLLVAGALPALGQAPRRPFPQHVTYAAGTAKPTHRSQADLDADVRAAYLRFKTAYLARAGSEPDGQPRYRILFGRGAAEKTVSEGQGYGMVIVALMAGADPDARTIFDGLWEYFNDHRSAIDHRLMTWQVFADESVDPESDDSAFDGDADIAYGLLLADRQWGSAGRIDYRHEAADVAAGLLASAVGPASHLPLLGDWVPPGGSPYNQYTVRTSDFMPGHFRAFARALGVPAWNDVAAAVIARAAALQDGFAPTTGLLPDFTVPTTAADPRPRPAPANFLEGDHDGDYFYNACRVPWRLGTDALLNGDPTTTALARKLGRWARTAAQGQPQRLHAGYRLDGTPLPASDYRSSAFVAPLGVAAMLEPGEPAWLDALYDTVRTAEQGYYEDSLALLGLLVMSGNFWDPSADPAEPFVCQPDDLTLCLDGGRFRVVANWQTPAAIGTGHARALTGDTGAFWFFAAANLELIVKVLDGCAVNGHHWVFAGGLTDVAVRLTVTDGATGLSRVYTNPPSTPFQPLQDTGAFATCP